MPNVKVYIDEAVLRDRSARLDSLMRQMRDILTAGFGVAAPACHIVILGVRTLGDQTPVNIELGLLQKAGRTRSMVEEVCTRLRALVVEVMDAPAAIRCTLAEPETYIVIRAG